VSGEADEVRDAIFAEKTYHVAYEPERCVRTHRWKYIQRFGERTRPVLPNTDDGPSKQLLLSYGWGEREIPPEQLYDLVLDPNESHNLAGDPAYSDTLEARGVDDRDERPAPRRGREGARRRRAQRP
jgi:N-sulfoglucosamine sulfohydrolase